MSDTLPFRQIPNRGEKPQYYVSGTHQPIIECGLFNDVQELIKSKKLHIDFTPQINVFSRKIKCVCGGTFRRKKIREKIYSFYKTIVHFLCLDQFADQFEEYSGGKYYKTIYRYNNISVKIPDSLLSDHTGFGIEFTGQGIDFYIDYMLSKFPDYDVRNLLSSFLSLAEDETLRCQVPRIDTASDDISYEVKKTYPLDLNLIKEALSNLEFSSPFAIKKHLKSFEVTFVDSERATLKNFRGQTIYLGNKKSKVFCRFYDKLAEMDVNKKEYDEKIKHWARMEFVFRNDRAMSIVENLISLSDDDFSKYYAEVVNL